MSVTSKNDSFPIRFKIPSQKISKSFVKLDDVHQYLQYEVEFWENIANKINDVHALEGRNNIFFDQIRRITVDAAQNVNDGSSYADAKTALDLLEANHAILSDGQYGQAIKSLAETNPTAVPGLVLGVFTYLNSDNRPQLNNWSQPADIFALSSGIAGTLGLIERQVSGSDKRTKLDSLTERFETTANNIGELKHEFEQWSAEQQNTLAALTENQVKLFKELLDKNERSLKESLNLSTKRIEELEEKIKERIVLEAPTKYWTTKAKGHWRVAWLAGAVFALVIAGGVYWVTAHGVETVADASKQIIGEGRGEGLVGLVPLAFITLPALAFAWVLRHVSRVVIQNISLAADASLRGTIATTYMALTADRNTTEAELALVLQALFRPIDGGSYGEIEPPNLRDLLEMSGAGTKKNEKG